LVITTPDDGSRTPLGAELFLPRGAANQRRKAVAFRDMNIEIPVTTPGKTGCPFIYNVSMAVGATGINRRDDVMLVQFFLRRIFGNPANALRVAPASLKPLEID